MQLDLDNVEGAAGDYNVTVATDGTVKRDGEGPQKLTLAAKQRGRISVPVTAQGSGVGTVTINVAGPNGFTQARGYALDVRPATQLLTRRTVRALATGETLTLSNDLFADFVPGTGRVGLSVGLSTSLDVGDACSMRSTAIRSAAPSRSPAARWRCSMSTNWRHRRGWRPTARSIRASRMPSRV